MRLLESHGEFVGGQPNARPVLGKVIADLVTLRHDSVHQLVLVLCPIRNQEESRSGTMPTQFIQDQRCGCRIGTIIQGQGNYGR